MTTFTLARIAGAKNSTQGEFRTASGMQLSAALERGRDMQDHPRIPAGNYPLRFKGSPSEFDQTFRELLGDAYKGVIVVTNVPGRTNIEIHPANAFAQLLGCIAPGLNVVRGADGEFSIPPGLSRPAAKTVYLALTTAIEVGPTMLDVVDEATADALVS